MFAEMIMIWLCLATSMIELFMLDLVMVMIYLFRNLIMQLPNYSTIQNLIIGNLLILLWLILLMH